MRLLSRVPRVPRSLLWSTALHGGALAVLVATGLATLARPRGRSTPHAVTLVLAQANEPWVESAAHPEELPDLLLEEEAAPEEPWLPLDTPLDEADWDPQGPPTGHEPMLEEAPLGGPGPDPFADLDPRTPVVPPVEPRAEVSEPVRSAQPLSEPTPAQLPAPSGVETDAPAPLLLEGEDPVYPLLARRKGWEGEVTLALVVSPTGRVTGARVLHSSGHSVLDQAAIDAVLGWNFAPARRDGVAIELEIEKHFRFDLGGG